MLHLPPTTISLSPNEIKEFDRRSRYRVYLYKHRQGIDRPHLTQPGSNHHQESAPATRGSPGMTLVHRPRRMDINYQASEHLKDPNGEANEYEGSAAGDIERDGPFLDTIYQHTTTPRLLSLPPRRPARPVRELEDSPGVTRSTEEVTSSSPPLPNEPTAIMTGNSPSQPSSYYKTCRGPKSTRPILPPPFSLSPRVISPQPPFTVLAGQLREDSSTVVQSGIRYEWPTTPPRRSSRSYEAQPLESSARPPSEQDSSIRHQPWPPDRTPGPRPPSSIDYPLSYTHSGGPVAAQSPARVDAMASQIAVYHDAWPGGSQPQTPQNLPEARHRSRVVGAYTAPVRRLIRHQGTLSMRRRARDRSPLGIEIPGFEGLYGGIENAGETSGVLSD